MWNKDVTLGEMVGNKHSFFSAMFVDNFKSIIAYTYNGAFYYWKYNQEEKAFRSQPIVHGHFGPVSDLDWDASDKKGYLVTTSEDQTTRIFAEWKGNRNKSNASEESTWHEINRPQIHGYDINTIACLTDKRNESYSCKLVAGADEKIIRVFDPPYNLIKYLQQLSNITINFSKEHDNSYYDKCKIPF
jgi:elongator complex protein 2